MSASGWYYMGGDFFGTKLRKWTGDQIVGTLNFFSTFDIMELQLYLSVFLSGPNDMSVTEGLATVIVFYNFLDMPVSCNIVSVVLNH